MLSLFIDSRTRLELQLLAPASPTHISHSLGPGAPVFPPPLAQGAVVPAPGGGTLVPDAQGAAVPSPGGGKRGVLAGRPLVLDGHGALVG